ncbi:MAG: hypothetical protein SFT92_01155 [Rickettsiales bacterium]|nr:hypothetical protein [Rickettsiales bacterium]
MTKRTFNTAVTILSVVLLIALGIAIYEGLGLYILAAVFIGLYVARQIWGPSRNLGFKTARKAIGV